MSSLASSMVSVIYILSPFILRCLYYSVSTFWVVSVSFYLLIGRIGLVYVNNSKKRNDYSDRNQLVNQSIS